MKLNDKHLSAFANGTAPIDKQGFLSKRGEVNKSYQKRYFILKGNLLFYYEKKGEKEPLGVVILEGCTVELSESSDSFTFELVFQGSGSRTYVLAADTQEDMEDWMKAIACASHDYMKLMVAELQRQMDDLNTDKTPISQSAPPPPTSFPAEGLLVDLMGTAMPAEAPPPVPKRPAAAARHNPFNSGPGQPAPAQAPSVSERGPRSFIEMHRDFGAYINKKFTEGQQTPIIASGLLD